MGTLTYSAITSLDGYLNDSAGGFGWAEPDGEVHRFVNELERPLTCHLYGRRMWEVMRFWATTPSAEDDETGVMRDYAAIWQSARHVVYSTTLTQLDAVQTELRHEFDAEDVRALKAANPGGLSIGGAHLAAAALAAGLVDELHQFVTPIVVGGGTSWLPADLHLALELVNSHQFSGGVVHLHYRARPSGARAAG